MKPLAHDMYAQVATNITLSKLELALLGIRDLDIGNEYGTLRLKTAPNP